MPLDWTWLLPVQEELKTKADGTELIFFRVDGFWKTELAKQYAGPCMVCKKDPQVGDIWCVVILGSQRREGHKECLDV